MKRKRLPGSLEGDFSRFRIDRGQRDAAVRLLQGRVILDSDWNEQADIQSYRRRRGFADLMGPAAAPAEDAGFLIASQSRLTFDGERHFIVIGGQGVDVWGGGAGFTIELFFQPEPGHGGVLFGRFSVGEAGSFGHDFTLALEADGRLQLHTADAVYEAPMRARPGRGNHLALTWNRNRATWLLNGRSSSFAAKLPLRRASSVYVLGATLRGGKPTQAFAGQMRELRFWGAERNAAELRQAAGDGQVADAEGAPALAGLWRFDRPGEGLEIADHGPHGVPAQLGGGHADYAPPAVAGQLCVLPGRFWIDGMLCHQERSEELASPTFEQLSDGLWLLYLEAQERLVSASQDARLLEPALGGADTSARSRVFSAVRAVRFDDGDPADGAAVLERWRLFKAAAERTGTLAAQRQKKMIGVEIGNLLYRAEVRSGGALAGSPWQGEGECIARWIELLDESGECTPAKARLRLDRWPQPHGPHVDQAGATESWRPGDALEIYGEHDDEIDQLFATVTTVDADKRELVVEAHNLELFADVLDLRIRRLATFVWSRDNGSVLFTVESVGAQGSEVQLETSVRGFELAIGQWVEWVHPEQPSPGSLHRVVSIDKVLSTVELEPPAPTAPLPEAPLNVVLRRWDQKPLEHSTLVGGAVVITPEVWQPLESGVEVRFSGDGPYRPGDYWWMPARTADSDIEWPRRSDGEPESRPPDGVERRRALLAAVSAPDEHGLEVVDYRRTFQPMIDGAVSKAGDTMYGPLRIESDLEVTGDISGRRLFGQLGSRGAVSELNLQDHAVTARTLAPDVGVVPPGASILGDSSEAPPGYRFTGASHLFYHPHPVWCQLEPTPRTDSRAQAAAAGGLIWLVYASGEAWSYDPAACCWRAAPPLPAPRKDFALASLDGAIYLVGGSGRGDLGTLRLDPQLGRWEGCAPLRHHRANLGLAALEGHLYAFGGLEGQKASDRLESFDPVLDRWRRCRPMPGARFDLAGAAACGRAFALGGAIKPTIDRFGCRLVSTTEAYHPASDRWLDHLAHLPSPRSELAAATVGDRLFAAGGTSTAGPLDLVDEYDPAPDFWRHVHQLQGPAPAPAAAALDGWLYVFGVDENGLPNGVYGAKVATELYVHRRLDLDAPPQPPPAPAAGESKPSPPPALPDLPTFDPAAG